MPKRRKPKTIKIIDDDGNVIDSPDVGIMGLFPPQDSDINEEFGNNEAIRDYLKENENLY